MFLEEEALSPEPGLSGAAPWKVDQDERGHPPAGFRSRIRFCDSPPDQPDFGHQTNPSWEREDLESTDSAAESDPQPNEPFGQAAADVPTLSDMEMHEASLTSNSQVPMAAVIIQEAAVWYRTVHEKNACGRNPRAGTFGL